MNIAVIGTGYVGLVVGACLADKGNTIICTDNNTEKINLLKNGVFTVYEPNLENIVKRNLEQNRLSFSNDIDKAIKFCDICIIAVNTPQNEDGSANTEYVYDTARQIGKSINGYKVIIIKSTCPVGTAQNLEQIIRTNTSQPFDIVSNPEFLKQGNAVEDFSEPDRIIIGSNSSKAIDIMKKLYYPLSENNHKFIVMDSKSAEMTKYAANSFLATKISFINEITNLCEKIGANPDKVKQGLASDSRIGDKFLNAGLGFGGSCFPKDIKALIKTGKDNGYEMDILEAAEKVNIRQSKIFLNKIYNRFGSDLKNITFGIWGLSFKPETNDIRQAPSITIIDELLKAGAKINAYDPKATENCKKIFKDNIVYTQKPYDVFENAAALLVLTEWSEFLKPDFSKIKSLMKNPIIFDGRNIYNPDELKSNEFEYYGIGK